MGTAGWRFPPHRTTHAWYPQWASSDLVPSYCGLWVALNDSLKLCSSTCLDLHILNGDLHGRGPWK